MKKRLTLPAAILAALASSSYADDNCFDYEKSLPDVFKCFQNRLDTQRLQLDTQKKRIAELEKENQAQQAEIQALKRWALTDDGLVAYYPFNGAANDASGYGHHGTVKGATLTADRFGSANSAYRFDGSSKIMVNSLKGFHWGNNFSVSVWFKRTGQWGNYQGIVNNGYSDNGSWEIRMGRENNGTMLGGGVVTATSPKTWDYVYLHASQNQWHHVVMAYNGSNLSFYLDGVAQSRSGNDTGEITAKNTQLTIGQAGIGMPREYFFCMIDEVRIYNRAISPKEIQSLYQQR